MIDLIGRAPEEILARERAEANGLWVALELYDPVRLPLRKIAAVGRNAREALKALEARGEAVGRYEVVRLRLD